MLLAMIKKYIFYQKKKRILIFLPNLFRISRWFNLIPTGDIYSYRYWYSFQSPILFWAKVIWIYMHTYIDILFNHQPFSWLKVIFFTFNQTFLYSDRIFGGRIGNHISRYLRLNFEAYNLLLAYCASNKFSLHCEIAIKATNNSGRPPAATDL